MSLVEESEREHRLLLTLLVEENKKGTLSAFPTSLVEENEKEARTASDFIDCGEREGNTDCFSNFIWSRRARWKHCLLFQLHLVDENEVEKAQSVFQLHLIEENKKSAQSVSDFIRRGERAQSQLHLIEENKKIAQSVSDFIRQGERAQSQLHLIEENKKSAHSVFDFIRRGETSTACFPTSSGRRE